MTSLFDVPNGAQSSTRVSAATASDAVMPGAPGFAAQDPDALVTGLNPGQRQAVAHRGEPLLVVAGAGSGKTRVLTRRIAYLMATGAALPGEILAITFTNKAAAEMKQRVAEAVGSRARAIWVSTFHSLCVRILRAEARFLPVKANFTIYDSGDSQRLVAIVARGLDLDVKRHTPRGLAAAISNLKNELVTPDEARDRAESDFDKLIADVYDGYQRRLALASSYDFDDLIMQTVLLLQSRPIVAEHYRRRFRHILVDEYQDTNHAQYVLVRELVGRASVAGDDVSPAELVVVGDADQSIYAFRGASIRNISEFEKDYPDAKTVLLEQNYRSTQTILSAANAVISQDHQRRHKNLWTDAGEGERVVGYVADDEYGEARFIADEIDRLCDTDDISYGDVAVFYRTNAASRAIEDVFVRTGMPYRIVGGVRFYERKEVRDALAYLRVVSNRTDEVSLRRILNTPKRGIGDKAQATVAIYAEQERISFADALAAYREVPFLASRSARAIGGFVELLDGLNEVVDSGGDPADIVTAVLERTGYRAQLAESDDPQDESRLDNLDQLVTVLREHAERVEDLRSVVSGSEGGSAGATASDPADDAASDAVDGASGGAADVAAPTAEEVAEPLSPRELLDAVLEQLALVADADSIPDSDEGVVTLMTLHSAKGLEFPVVFLTGWEDGMFPHQRSMGDERELAEERRLAYVGITRARQRLYVSRAATRSAWGTPMENPPSRFLDDIPESLMDWQRLLDQAEPFAVRPSWSGYHGGNRSQGYSTGNDRSAPVAASRFATSSSRSRSKSGAPRGPALVLAAGDMVTHDKYGLGTVTEVAGAGPLTTAVIDFKSSGTVRMVLNGSAPMTKL